MRLLALLLMVGILSSCGKKTIDKAKSEVKLPDNITSLTQNLVLTANNETEGEVVSFGTYSSAATVKTVRVFITNSSSSAVQLNDLKTLIEAWDNDTSNPNSVTVTDAAASTSKCVSRTISKNKSCYFDVTLSYNEELDNNTLIVPLRGADTLTAPTLQLVMDVSESYLQSEATISAAASLVKNTEVLNFGNLLPDTSVTRRLYIGNINTTTDIAAPALPGTLPLGLTVERNICTGIIKAKGQCFIDFKYSYQATNLSQAINFTSSQMTTGQQSLDLIANNLQDNIVENEPKLSFVYENFPSTSSAGGSYIRRLTITNNSNLNSYTFGATEVGSLFTDPSLTVLRNTCDGKVLGKNKLCYVDVQHQPSVDNQQLQITLALPAANVPAQTIITGPAPVACTPGNSGIANASTVSGNTPACTLLTCNPNYDKVGNNCVAQACNPLDFSNASTLSGNKAIGCSIATCSTNYTLNMGVCSPTICSPSDIANSATVSGDKVSGCIAVTCSAGFSKVGNTCVSSNVTRACAIQPGNSTGGLESSTDGGITFGACSGFNCSANYSVSGNSCAPAVCVPSDISFAATVSGDKVNGCTVQSCIPTYSVVNNSCVSSGVTRACTTQPSNSAGGQELSSDGGLTFGACSGFTCSTNYSISGNSCIPTLCSTSDVANSATVSGDKVNGCTALTCNATFSAVGGVCVSSNVTRACQTQPGNSSGGLESSIDGGVTFGTCTGFTCAANYQTSGQSCIPQACNIADYPGAASVTGDKVAGCVVQSCTSSFQEVISNACSDKTPTGSISFASSRTKTEINQLDILSTNAQKIQLFSGSDCVLMQGISENISSSINATIMSGDGIQSVSAIFINGSKSSNCFNASIIMDKTPPSLAIINPSSGQNVADNSLSLSGTCAESSPSNVAISINVGGIISSTICSGTSFNTSIDIASLTVGTKNIQLSATDDLGNIGTTSRSFNRLICAAYQISGGTSCVDAPVTNPNFSFEKNHTNSSSNVVYASATNAQEIELFTDSACSSKIYGPSAVASLNNSSVNFSFSGDGVKTIYARFKNGTQQSACVSDTITYDTTAPSSFTLSLGSTTTASATSTPVANFGVTLSSLDSLSGMYTAEFGVGTNTTSANISPFQSISTSLSSLTASVANSFLHPSTVFVASTNYYSLVRLTDNAGNQRIVASSAWTYFVAPSFTSYTRTINSATPLATETTSGQAGGVTFSSSGALLAANSAATGASATYINNIPDAPTSGVANVRLTINFSISVIPTKPNANLSFTVFGVSMPIAEADKAIGSYSRTYSVPGASLSGGQFRVFSSNGRPTGLGNAGGPNYNIRIQSYTISFY